MGHRGHRRPLQSLLKQNPPSASISPTSHNSFPLAAWHAGVMAGAVQEASREGRVRGCCAGEKPGVYVHGAALYLQCIYSLHSILSSALYLWINQTYVCAPCQVQVSHKQHTMVRTL
jgi:hypothetical protein